MIWETTLKLVGFLPDTIKQDKRHEVARALRTRIIQGARHPDEYSIDEMTDQINVYRRGRLIAVYMP
jgi:hypothetical protein